MEYFVFKITFILRLLLYRFDISAYAAAAYLKLELFYFYPVHFGDELLQRATG